MPEAERPRNPADVLRTGREAVAVVESSHKKVIAEAMERLDAIQSEKVVLWKEIRSYDDPIRTATADIAEMKKQKKSDEMIDPLKSALSELEQGKYFFSQQHGALESEEMQLKARPEIKKELEEREKARATGAARGRETKSRLDVEELEKEFNKKTAEFKTLKKDIDNLVINEGRSWKAINEINTALKPLRDALQDAKRRYNKKDDEKSLQRLKDAGADLDLLRSDGADASTNKFDGSILATLRIARSKFGALELGLKMTLDKLIKLVPADLPARAKNLRAEKANEEKSRTNLDEWRRKLNEIKEELSKMTGEIRHGEHKSRSGPSDAYQGDMFPYAKAAYDRMVKTLNELQLSHY